MNADELRVLCDAVVRLTELRLKECGHLCIENFAPELLAKMIGATNSGLSYKEPDPRWWTNEHRKEG